MLSSMESTCDVDFWYNNLVFCSHKTQVQNCVPILSKNVMIIVQLISDDTYPYTFQPQSVVVCYLVTHTGLTCEPTIQFSELC